ncbi:ABC transporter substrate-binding protein [Pseudonocardia sp. RS010]|uniref:ABC transporter substrate-binding protein n=1 Tax=Pseudonocardia sp. RS010 TaxID=3385979 RepID=UPI0039A2AC72
MSRRDSARRGAAALVAAAGLMVLAACGGGSAPTAGTGAATGPVDPAAAAAEGEIVLYTPTVDASNTALVKAFNAKYASIKVTINKQGDSALTPLVEAESQTGKGVGDVYLTADPGFIPKHVDMLAPIQSTARKDPAYSPYVSRDAKSVVVQVTPYGLAWNTKTVPGGLKSWNDLATLDPALRIGVDDPSVAIAAGGWMYLMNQKFGPELLCNMAGAHKVNLYPNSSTMQQALASGEIDVGMPALSTVNALKASGAPIDVAFPDPVFAPTISATVLKTAPHPQAAQLFVDFALSAEGQQAFNAGVYSVPSGIPGTLGNISQIADRIDTSAISAADMKSTATNFAQCRTKS